MKTDSGVRPVAVARLGTVNDYAKEAALAYANLNAWAAVVAVLEGGTLSGEETHKAQQRVIKIAKAEIQKHLREYDMALAFVQTLS